MATSAPSPPVRSRTIARASSRPLLIVMSAPNCLAASSRLSARSIATTWAGAEQPGAHDRREPDRAGADDGDDVAGSDLSVEDADLVAGREDVGEHEDLLVVDTGRDRIRRGVGEGHADVLGLGAVDLVTEDPAAAAEALAVAALPAVAAGPACGDARDEHAVADLDVLHSGAYGFDGADGFVAEDAPVGDGGDVALEDVEVGPADRHRVDSYDASVSSMTVGFGTSSQAFWPGPWYTSARIGCLLVGRARSHASPVVSTVEMAWTAH